MELISVSSQAEDLPPYKKREKRDTITK